ncbi:DUF2789 family protein [Azonexus sp.]|uniref:DUF2789 family protein n=1 Tax=Azonexus sp. TaxID=1872668 RepID=UPI0039E58828
MSSNQHTLAHLFAQLGLPSQAHEIEAFIATHRPLANGTALYRAALWNSAQRAFLKEEIIEDADWALAIEELNARLH